MDSSEILAKYTIKDSVFTHLFKEKKYTLELYKALHPESGDVTEEDINPITLENVLMANMYNDLGFSIKDKIFILTEAQTTWSVNIIIRMFMYLAETYHAYYMETEQTLYSPKKVSFPKPELYMIYTGKKGNKKDVISLTEEFLNGVESSIEVKVKVIFDSQNGDIINQYIAFTKVYDEQVKIHGRTRKAVDETIRICKERDILKEYLSSREKEVTSIMMTLFDAEYNLKVYTKDVEKKAEARGIEQGVKQGIEQGRQQNKKEIAKSLLDVLDVETIAHKTGLTISEVESLKAQDTN